MLVRMRGKRNPSAWYLVDAHWYIYFFVSNIKYVLPCFSFLCFALWNHLSFWNIGFLLQLDLYPKETISEWQKHSCMFTFIAVLFIILSQGMKSSYMPGTDKKSRMCTHVYAHTMKYYTSIKSILFYNLQQKV
jgi:hypothetical protein